MEEVDLAVVPVVVVALVAGGMEKSEEEAVVNVDAELVVEAVVDSSLVITTVTIAEGEMMVIPELATAGTDLLADSNNKETLMTLLVLVAVIGMMEVVVLLVVVMTLLGLQAGLQGQQVQAVVAVVVVMLLMMILAGLVLTAEILPKETKKREVVVAY